MTRARYERRIAANPQMVVAQCGSWCGLRCTYCYLPDRHKKFLMSAEVATALARSLAELPGDGRPVEVVWHAGEPLGIGRARFARLLEPFEELREQGRIRHYVQTNATMVTAAWCDFLTEYDFAVGVSIDGPAALNAQRVDQRGRPAFDRIMRGIGQLREHRITFSVIAVVTAESVEHPVELLEFLSSLGATSIGLNIEESEGVNTTRRPPTVDQARAFWQAAIEWSRLHRGVRIRELARLGDFLRDLRHPADSLRAVGLLDPIPTVTWDGNVTLLSPELAGTPAPGYDDFRSGNILDQPLAEILAGAHRLRYVGEFLSALDACEASCQFWSFCRGAQAGNRFFEYGRLDVAETHYCRSTRQALVTGLSDTVREEHTSCS